MTHRAGRQDQWLGVTAHRLAGLERPSSERPRTGVMRWADVRRTVSQRIADDFGKGMRHSILGQARHRVLKAEANPAPPTLLVPATARPEASAERGRAARR